MSVPTEKNKKNLSFVIFINRKCLKAISSVKTKKVTKSFQRKNINFWNHFLKLFFNIYTTGFGYFFCTTYHFNSQSMGRPDTRKSGRDSRFVG